MDTSFSPEYGHGCSASWPLTQAIRLLAIEKIMKGKRLLYEENEE
jgi:hypothetical protein